MRDDPLIVVVGAGPVGATLALALAEHGFAPVVLESREAGVEPDDPRPLALSHGSRLILERLQVWQALDSVTPIETIHVSQQGGFGRVAMTAAEAGLPALGYVVAYKALREALAKALGERITRYRRGAGVGEVKPSPDAATVNFTHEGIQQALVADLVAVAEGGALAGLVKATKLDYRQAAVVALVRSERPHRNTAFERFTPGGPLALLPCGEALALVWGVSASAARQLCEEPEAAFVRRLSEHFGGRLGHFSLLGGRTFFPLSLKFAREVVLPHVALIGNAAQTLHPVAGQGLNLGLRDAWELATEVAAAPRQAIGTAPMLAAYRRRRETDRRGGALFTDALVRIFSNDFPPLRAARGMGLALLGCLPAAKNFLVRRMTFGTRG